MPSVLTTLEIDAAPAAIYRVLTDLDAYPTWNPVIKWMRGEAKVGGTLRFRIDIPSLPPLLFKAKVTLADELLGFAWEGGPPAVFAGHHYLRFEPVSKTRTRLVHGEDFSGALRNVVVNGFVRKRIESGYEVLNRAVAARVKALS